MTTWTNETTLEFIHLYEQESAIWNPKNPAHKNKNLVADAWARISYTLSIKCTVSELKKKKESLMATFRPLLNNVKCSTKTGSSPDNIYKPNWFAYEAMAKFLSGIYVPRNTINTQGLDNIDSGDVLSETEFEQDIKSDERACSDNVGLSTPSSNAQPSSMPNKKRKTSLSFQSIEGRLNEAYGVMKSLSEKKSKDVCELYGELIAEKLRSFDEKTRFLVMHEIDSLILKAKMSPVYQPHTLIPISRSLYNNDISRPASTAFNTFNYSESLPPSVPFPLFSQPPSTLSQISPDTSSNILSQNILSQTTFDPHTHSQFNNQQNTNLQPHSLFSPNNLTENQTPTDRNLDFY